MYQTDTSSGVLNCPKRCESGEFEVIVFHVFVLLLLCKINVIYILVGFTLPYMYANLQYLDYCLIEIVCTQKYTAYNVVLILCAQ